MNPSRASPSPAPAPSIHPPAVQRVFDDRWFRADGDLLALNFADDGTLWTVEDPGLLRRWDLSGRRQLEWHLLSELENLWTFSRDGLVLASASDELSLWDVPGGQLQAVLPQPSWVTALALRGDAGLVATGHEDGAVCLWDAANDEHVRELRGHRLQISALAFSSDGTRLASAGEDRVIRVWDVATGREIAVLEGPNDRIPALVWHPNGQRLYSAAWDTSVWVWDVATATPVILLNSHTSQVQALAISADGTRLACADLDQAIHLWDLVSHKPLRVLRGLEGEVRCLAFQAEGNVLASGGSDRVVHLWNPTASADEAEERLYGPQGEVFHSRPANARVGLAVSPDGARLASLCPGKGVRVWDVVTERKVYDLAESDGLNVVAWSPDGRCIAAGCADTTVRLWEATTGCLQATLDGSALPVTALAFAPAGRLLASASGIGCDVWLWDAKRGKPALLVPDAVDGCAIEALAFQPQGELLAVAGIDWLATGGSDGAIHLWDVVQPSRRLTLAGGVRALAFHPTGRMLAAASLVRTVCVWDVQSGRLMRELAGHEDAVNCVAYSPDGRRLASAADDHTVRLWDAATGAALGVTELDTQVKVLCFGPDGRLLFTGNGNSSCYALKTQRLLNDGR
jgi:WD40 repeat protein